jgi:hypothetical protein
MTGKMVKLILYNIWTKINKPIRILIGRPDQIATG